MYASQSEGQNRSGDRVDFFGGGKRQNSGDLELIDINFGNRDLALSPVGNVFVPVGELKRQAVISSGKRQHAFVGEGLVFNILKAALVEGIAQILLRDENQLVGVAYQKPARESAGYTSRRSSLVAVTLKSLGDLRASE